MITNEALDSAVKNAKAQTARARRATCKGRIVLTPDVYGTFKYIFGRDVATQQNSSCEIFCEISVESSCVKKGSLKIAKVESVVSVSYVEMILFLHFSVLQRTF